jgi:hypothetical protein
MPPSRELKSYPAVLENAAAWDVTPGQLAEQVEKISVSFSWAPPPPPPPEPISFRDWILSDERRCPQLFFVLTEHSHRYRADPRFHAMNFEEWEQFANIHGVLGDEFLAAWRKYTRVN